MQIYSQNGNNVTVKTFNTYNSCLSLPPSKPQFLKVSRSTNNHPLLTWEANIEPDKSYYKIYKYITYEIGWQMIGIASTPYYEDQTESYCPVGQQCQSGHNVQYSVTCMDTQNKESLKADLVITHVLGGAPDKIVVNPPLENIPSEYSLSTNYPNPFNPSTIINYSVKDAGLVRIKVYDILGAEVFTLINEIKEAGEYAVEFNASNLPSGVYIYTMQVNGFASSKKMLLMK